MNEGQQWLKVSFKLDEERTGIKDLGFDIERNLSKCLGKWQQ